MTFFYKENGIKMSRCLCGCGTEIEPFTAQGLPRRFVHGHNGRGEGNDHNYVEEDHGFGTPCWVWQGARNSEGYGQLRRDDRIVYAHRLHYELRHGQTSAEIDHLCRVRACCNPDHLEAVDHPENVRRGAGTRLTPDDVRAIRRSTLSQRELGRIYGVNHGHICRIRQGKVWVGI